MTIKTIKQIEKDDVLHIRVRKSEDFSEWYVEADMYNCSYHSSAVGYKGKTPQEKINNLIEEIKNDLREDGFKYFKVDYYTTLPNKDEESKEEFVDDSLNVSEEDEIKKAEKKAETEFNKALNKISKEKDDVIEDYFSILKHYAKMVGLGHHKGLIVYGQAGLGKSHNVMKAFKEVDKKFIYMTGHITNLELYQFIYKHRKENIILDDVNILDNEINLNMLKSALNDKFPRVCYHTSSTKLKVPSMFLFEGSITILLNKKPNNNESLKAVESRILTYELKLNYEDKIKIMKQITLMKYKGLKQEDKDIIFNWLKDNTSEATENFNLRVMFHLYEMYKYSKENWIKLAKKIIINNYEIELILSGLNSWEWSNKTNKSSATYYRYKEQLNN